tara:strand:- start:867 stop:1781 length:915 start_codon:yes stop_codon:yes gene_type:complete
MKKILLILVFSFLSLSFYLSSRFKKTEVKDADTIIVSFTILEDIVSQIAGEEFDVYSITEPGEEVHGYKPTPSDLIKASNGLIFIENGFGFELWSDKFLSNLNLERITISDYLEPIYITEDAYTGKPNPHAWISPKRGKIYIDAIVLALTELKPESEEIFVKNGKIYKDRLSQIDKEFSLFINTLKKNERYLVSCEGAFSYLTNDYGLEEAYLWPVNAETQITPKRMAKVIKTVKENDIPAVFCESTVSAESQLTVVEETGAIFGGNLFVDSLSLEGGPASTYIELLEYNLETIKNSFHTHQEG